MARGAAADTSARNVEGRERAAQALALRRQGLTLDAIARQLGYADRSGVHRALTAAMEELGVEDAQQLRTTQAEQIDELLASLLPRALEGDLPAADRVIRAWERQARLLGLDMPAQSTTTVEVGQSTTEAAATIAASQSLDELLGTDPAGARRVARVLAEVLPASARTSSLAE